MSYVAAVVIFVFGLCIGGVIIFLMLRWKLKSEVDRVRMQGEIGRSTMTERLSHRETQLQELQNALESVRGEVLALREELKSQSEKRSAAEEKATRIPEMESILSLREKVIAALHEEKAGLQAKLTEADTRVIEERKAAEEKLRLIDDARQKLSDAFKALAADALRSSNQSFLELARETLERYQESARTDLQIRQKEIDEIVKPLKESLVKVDDAVRGIEIERKSAYDLLTDQIKSLASTQGLLQTETSKLVRALRTPVVRGRWGEIQLKRVVEMAGMVEYCDFLQQESVTTEESRLRPDMIIKLPNDRNVVVDSKVPLQAYLDALEAQDEETRVEKLKEHARHVRSHLTGLGRKDYWDQFKPAPEFAVLFLPGETFFSAALEQDPGLIEYGIDQRVIPATPTTLIALLKAVAYGWRQEKIAASAEEISRLGKTLYDRIKVLAGHFSDMGKSLDRTVDLYNKAVGSLESRVLVTARRFRELGVSTGEEIEAPDSLDRTSRLLQSPEMSGNEPEKNG
jgi:DNA recombination protein RmuC